jgi:protein TonB
MTAPASPAEFATSRHDDEDAPYREPLSARMRIGLMALVIFFHVGGAWALISIEPTKLEVGDVASMEVRLVPSEQQAAAQPEQQPDLPTPPDDTPPPEVPMVESMIQPPMPDLPPPEFPVNTPPPKPKPPAPKPKPAQVAPPSDAAPSQATASAAPSTAPQTLSTLQVTYLVAPVLVYPGRAKRAGEQGVTYVRAYVDASGVPVQVVVEKSSGHSSLDEAALSAMRGARIKTSGRAFWVVGPFEFKLQK